METSVPPPKGPQQTTAASLRTPCGIGDLPPEVLLKIFKFINVNQLESTISPVCRHWHNLSQRPCVRLELTLEGEKQDTAHFCELLRSCPNLKDLSIFVRHDGNTLLHYVALYNLELRRLVVKVYNNSLNNYYIRKQILERILICCSHLVDLTLKYSSFHSENFFNELGVRLSELRKININKSVSFGSYELRMIALHCGKLEEIRALRPMISFAAPFCSDDDFILLAQRLWGTLKVLKIDCNEISDEGMAALAQCCQLRKLHIQSALNITDNGVLHLLLLRNLETLHLSLVGKVTSGGWVQLFCQSH